MEVFYKNILIKISQYSHENTCVGVSLQVFTPAILLRDSNTDGFLWILQKF